MLFMRTSPVATGAGKETRERILVAALDAFAERSYEGATTREIAHRAGVPLGLLRYYFGDKLKLWKAAVDRAFAEIRTGLDSAIAGEPGSTGDDLERVRAGIRAHVHFVARNPEFVRLMHDEGKRRGPRARWLADRYVKPMFDRLVPMMGRLQQQGRLPKDIAPLHFAYALVGAIDVIFHQAEECRRVTGVDPQDPEVIAAHARAVEYLLLGPARDASSP